MDKYKIIELLECARFNADNIRKAGPVFIDLVKAQIDEAIELLEGDEALEAHDAS
ncbi:MAG: hypothetical protein PHC68_08205 [Syntrophorhabdaceae bacterium]|nr:hypothetical protein [Syntrophorhabdaceae bacterium]